VVRVVLPGDTVRKPPVVLRRQVRVVVQQVVHLLAPGEFVPVLVDVAASITGDGAATLARRCPHLADPDHPRGEVRRHARDGRRRAFDGRGKVVAPVAVGLDPLVEKPVEPGACCGVAGIGEVDVDVDFRGSAVIVDIDQGGSRWGVGRGVFALALPVVVEPAVVLVALVEASRVDEDEIGGGFGRKRRVDAALAVATCGAVVVVVVHAVGVVRIDDAGEDFDGLAGDYEQVAAAFAVGRFQDPHAGQKERALALADALEELGIDDEHGENAVVTRSERQSAIVGDPQVAAVPEDVHSDRWSGPDKCGEPYRFGAATAASVLHCAEMTFEKYTSQTVERHDMSPVSRRRVLQTVSGLVAGLAGCSLVPGESSSMPVPTAWTNDVRRPSPGAGIDGRPLVVGRASPWSDEECLLGIDPSSGDKQWSVPAEGDEGSSAVAHDGSTAFSYTTTGKVRAVDAADGTVGWEVDTGGWDFRRPEVRLSAPLVVDDVVVIPASWPGYDGADHDHRLLAFDAESGDNLWRYSLSAPLSGTPAASDGAVVLPRTDGVIEAVDATGEGLWRTERSDRFESASATDGRAFVGTAGERFDVFDLANGEPRWGFETENAVLTPPHLVDGVVYVGSADYRLYAVDAASGEELWRSETANAVTSGPVKVDDALVSVVGGLNNGPFRDRRYHYEPEAVYVHDAANGDVRGEFVYDEGSPQWVQNIDGAVYIGHERGLVKLSGGALDD